LFSTELQVALGTRAMVLHLAIKECMKQQAAGAGSKRAATGSSASLTPLVTELLLTVQKLYVLDAEALMQPILHQVAADSSSDSKKSKSNKSASSQSEAAPSSSAGTSKQAKGSSKSNGQSQGHSGVAVRVMSSKSGRTTCAVAAVLAALHSIGFSSVADRLAQELSLSYATAQATQGSDSGASKSKATGKGSSNKGDKVTGPAPGTAAGSHNSHEVQEQILSALAAATAAVKLSSVQLPAGMCPVRFQLREMGHLLVRPPSGLPKDGRVGGFDPDDWQRKVLDIVDAGRQWMPWTVQGLSYNRLQYSHLCKTEYDTIVKLQLCTLACLLQVLQPSSVRQHHQVCCHLQHGYTVT
jgi:hypothetical protein